VRIGHSVGYATFGVALAAFPACTVSPHATVGIPKIPTFDHCAANPNGPGIVVTPGLPVVGITAVERPQEVKNANQLPGLLALYDGRCVTFVTSHGTTMLFSFKTGTDRSVVQEVASYLKSTKDFSKVTVLP
jgi:hypothetical protein